jgi:beta-mannanase
MDQYTDDAINATNAFGAWRKSPTTVAVAWPNYSTWATFTEPNALYANWATQSYTKVFGVPPFPANSGATIAGCVAGDYDSYWSTFAKTMVSTGLAAQGTIIRLGWEMNQHTDWGTPTQFAACWRNIVSTVGAIAPGLQWDWNVNRGPSGDMPGDTVLDAYPGDAYVNIIGVDAYDLWPPVNTSGGWQQQLNGPYGLNYWLSFAKEHGKQFSVPEWGISQNVDPAWDGHTGGDDPDYIKDMYDFFAANSSMIAFESYFDFTDNDNSIYNPVQVPSASAEYLSLWG